LDAARAVLMEKGYHDVRLEDVARRARAAKGTVYLYFSDKEQLCAAVMRDVMERLDERVAAIPDGRTALDTLARIAETEIRFIAENRDFLAQFAPMRPLPGGVSAKGTLKTCFGGHLQALSARIEACVREGSLCPCPPRRAALFFVTLARMFAIHVVPEDVRRPASAHAADLMDLFVNGVGRRPARKSRPRRT
jgi:TetR/AcrR family fatty acid metabolism transcriptional regulator